MWRSVRSGISHCERRERFSFDRLHITRPFRLMVLNRTQLMSKCLSSLATSQAANSGLAIDPESDLVSGSMLVIAACPGQD